MARNLGFLVLALFVASICEAAVFTPISDSHRSAALELFAATDGSLQSLEETYEALRTFEVLGIDKKSEIKTSTCKTVDDTLWSASSAPKDLFQALRVNGILKCDLNDEAFTGIASRLKDSVRDASTLLDFYYSISSLMLIKGQTSEVDVKLEDADGVFRAIKALSQSDGRWRFSTNNPESSTYAAGLALETLAGVISLASQEIDQSLIESVKKDVLKLFDATEKYDDGSCYFVDAQGSEGPISASSAVIRGITSLASSTSESLNLSGDKIMCLAKFFLGIGIPGSFKDLYYQVDALACLDKNGVSVPLILSLPASVLSVTQKDQLKVRVNTVLGSPAPPLSVKLMQIFTSGSKDASIIDQELKFDPATGLHVLETLPESIDIGSYTFSFEILLRDPEHKKTYATGGRTKLPVYVTGVVDVDQAEIIILDSDLGSAETKKKINVNGENSFALSANHLQKLRLTFQLTTPSGNAFKPHQAFLRLKHESGVEHLFLVGNSGKKFEIILDFLGLVEKFFYLSGRYDIQLTVGDSVMENSFFQPLGHVELDLPEAPEKAARPPPPPVDPISKYGPKAEITHIFRSPEKRPPMELSFTFLGLVLLPFLGFLIGLLVLRVNLKNFPSAALPAVFAIAFHLGIGAVLSLYFVFWLKDPFPPCLHIGKVEILLMNPSIKSSAIWRTGPVVSLYTRSDVIIPMEPSTSKPSTGRKRQREQEVSSPENHTAGDNLIFSDTSVALQMMRSQFPRIDKVSIQPFILRSQLYSSIKDRTQVDRELENLKREMVIRIFKLSTGQDDHAIMFLDDYHSQIERAVKRLNAKKQDDLVVFEWFKTHVLPSKPDPSIGHQELHSLLSVAGKVKEEHISLIINAGLLTRQLIDPNMYWFAIPNIGSILKGLTQGRKELLSFLNRRKYKEMMLSLLEKKRLRFSLLDMRFHLRDLIGSGGMIGYGEFVAIIYKGNGGIWMVVNAKHSQ
ncbi:OLC1v1007010C1 [Oldenlandia corymbosa var. corymbosa]|uniref:Ribophorin II n=1 Tax=Oldenlandia corymbosa var. corymbosa TaxID=529605 RepID=A0AAV1DIM1_OLDCO|nr:OLC1v1007010C1 [Oldenlandia corymbosa var. corymbosa]